jgi:signal peptidase I
MGEGGDPAKARRGWGAALSLLVPGAGHAARGHLQRGLLWFSSLLILSHATLALLLVVRSGIAVPILFVTAAGAAIALRVCALVDALRVAAPARLPGAGRVVVACLVLAAATIGASLITPRFARAYRIPSGAMIPTMQVGDQILAQRGGTPGRGEVIVFRYPKDPRKDFIKRVVAVGGDTVEIREGVPVVNGQPLPREAAPADDPSCPYRDFDEMTEQWNTRPCRALREAQGARRYTVIEDHEGPARSFPTVSVPPGHFYVLGDNRDNSHDSRYWGTVPGELVEERAFVVYWPAEGMGARVGRTLE